MANAETHSADVAQVARIRRDRDAIVEVVLTYEGELLRYCLRRTGDAGTAEDIVSESLEKLYFDIMSGAYDGTEQSIKTFLYRKTKRGLFKYFRAHRRLERRKDKVVADPTLSPRFLPRPRRRADEHAAANDIGAILEGCIQLLPEHERSVADMYYRRDLTRDTIAAVLGRSAGWITKVKKKAIKHLEQCLRRKGVTRYEG